MIILQDETSVSTLLIVIILTLALPLLLLLTDTLCAQVCNSSSVKSSPQNFCSVTRVTIQHYET
jgi:hypothetical protein